MQGLKGIERSMRIYSHLIIGFGLLAYENGVNFTIIAWGAMLKMYNLLCGGRKIKIMFIIPLENGLLVSAFHSFDIIPENAFVIHTHT